MFFPVSALAFTQAVASVLAFSVLTGGPIDLPRATPEPDPISKVIVRYGDGATAERVDGKPWGAQCVDRRYRERLVPGRALGAGMYLIRIKPAVSPVEAKRIIRQLDRCPGVAWAEAPTVQFGPGGSTSGGS